jgi:Ca2+-transporting ATPase
MCFLTLITANIFLTLVNRSFYDSLLKTLRYKNNLVPGIIAITIFITMALVFIKPLASFFLFEQVSSTALFICLISGFCSVIWFEMVKWINRKNS